MPTLLLGAAALLRAQAPPGPLALRQVEALAAQIGEGTAFLPLSTVREGTRGSQVRFQQVLRGIRVFASGAVLHLDPDGAPTGLSDFSTRVRMDPATLVPSLGAPEALALVARDLGDPEAHPRFLLEPVIFEPDPALAPQAGGRNLRLSGAPPAGPRLAYHVRSRLDGPRGPRETETLVDAHTGRILARWDALHTVGSPARIPPRASTQTRGNGFYSGVVALEATPAEKGQEVLRDTTRGTRPHPLFPDTIGTGNVVLNGRFQGEYAPADKEVPAYTAPAGEWGDGTLFADDGTTDTSQSPAALAVAVDIAHGLAVTWDFYRKVLGRNGIDDQGGTVYAEAHTQHGYVNASWSDLCFCMTYGDGDADGDVPDSRWRMAPLTTLDITGHELTHGVTAATADLVYQGESGGLNEAASDILGRMILFFGQDPSASRVPDDCPACTWGLGQILIDPAHPGDPSQWGYLRRMDRPSLDGKSLDAWQPGMEDLNVHALSGPMNRAFHYLAHGAPDDPLSVSASGWLRKGMKGLGNDAATRLWYRTLTGGRLPRRATYGQARQAALLAAGEDRLAVSAVADAFAAINVGLPDAPFSVVRVGADGVRDPSVGGILDPGKSITYRASVTGVTWTADGPDLVLAPGKGGRCVLKAKAEVREGIRSLTCTETATGHAVTFGVLVRKKDLDGDGRTDVWDLARLVQSWGRPDPAGDLNGDGVVNDGDLALLLAFP